MLVKNIKKFIYAGMLQLLRVIPSEFSHSIFIFVARYFWFLMPKLKFSHNHNIKFFNKVLYNPYGVAAGLDKNSRAVKGLFQMGFSFVEVGTITPKPQYGNQKPRIFRFKGAKSILNFMGFPNDGSSIILRRVKYLKRSEDRMLGVNIGRNKDGSNDDYIYLIEKFHKHCDYITINISSPNTPNLRENINNISRLDELLLDINNFRIENSVVIPIFLKLTPDLTNLQEVYNVSCKHNIDGFILTNTTVDKSQLPQKFQSLKMGGVSGGLLKEKSFQVLQEFNKINVHKKFVISCGGVDSAAEAQKRLNNGASAVQIYTPLIYGAFL